MIIKQANLHHDFLNGLLVGDKVTKSIKLYRDAKAFYLNADNSLSEETVMYEVYTYCEDDKIGSLNYGLTVLHPQCINDECNMTRGHFHSDLDSDEIYFGCSGNGLLLLMDEYGNCEAEKVEAGSVHYIDGHYAHRLINTGDSDLKVGAIWPVQSGHDYQRVEEHHFTVRVYLKNNQVVWEEEK